MLGALLAMSPSWVMADPALGGARDAQPAGQSRLQELLARTLAVVRRDRPSWLLERTRDPADPALIPDDLAQLVLQQERPDGAELLTLRYPLLAHGRLRTYAGAGLNRAVYFADDGGAPVMLTRGNRERSLGAAAELGAELQLGSRGMLSADLRWADLHDDAILLRSGDGIVGADAVSLGLALGWRFR